MLLFFLFYLAFIVVFFKTILANSLVIELHVANRVSADVFACKQWRHLIEYVVHLAATLAIEVSMSIYVAIVAHAVIIYCYHLRGIMFGEHAERIIDCSAT